jgi:Flp pilus assembly protein TadG
MSADAPRLLSRHASAQQWISQQNGNSLVEFALTLPALCLFFFVFMETALALYTRDLIAECAREGSRYAMVRGASCPTSANPTCEVTATQVNTYVSALKYPNIGGGTMSVVTTYPDGDESPGSHVQVSITYNFPITMPFVPKHTLTLTSTSKVVILQ